MKRILAAAIVALGGLVAVPNTAQAGVQFHIGFTDHYVSGRASCGCPIYTKRVCRGYDHYRRPIFGYYRQPFQCKCRSSHGSHRGYHPHSYYGKHGAYHHQRRAFGRPMTGYESARHRRGHSSKRCR